RPVLLEAHIAWKRNRTREAAGLIAEARGLKHLPQNYFRMAGISWAIRWEANMQANFSQAIKQNYTPIWPEALEDEWHAVVAPLTRQYDRDRARLFEESRKFGEVWYEKAGTKHNLSRLFPDIEALYQKHRFEEEYAF